MVRTGNEELQDLPTGSLTIGELARQTGLSPATLRMWEVRHGFPTARRLASGHRRYDPGTVERVRAVLNRQSAGVRLEAAIADVGELPRTPSVHAALRASHPQLTTQVLRKSTLVALSHAIEDEQLARADHPVLFGSFQREAHLRSSLARWEDLARTARATFAFAAGPISDLDGGRIAHVPLTEDAPMCREWALICDGTALPVALSAWELPGQDEVDEGSRRFEAMWTLDPVAVRTAARTCARLAADAGVQPATTLVDELAAPPRTDHGDLSAASRLFSRIVAYIEQAAHH